MIDLHLHSTFSDGSLTPEALVERADKLGLTAIALTDHDSTDGLDRFRAACAGRVLAGIGGVEISCDVARGTMHLLGYFVDPDHAALANVLRQIRDGRSVRNEKIRAKLKDLGLELTAEEVAARAGEEVVGRPHFAGAMQARGYVKSTSEAFEKYLAKGRPAYADRFRLSPADGIAAIRQAGGVPVLAHPLTLDLNDGELRARVRQLAEWGLGGIEAYYSEHSADRAGQYVELARAFGLALTGGSDFHGDLNPDIRMGRGFGGLRVPDELVPALVAAARKVRGGEGALRSPDDLLW